MKRSLSGLIFRPSPIKKQVIGLFILLNLSLSALSQEIRISCNDEPLSEIMVALRDTAKLMVSFDDRLLSSFRLTLDMQFDSYPHAFDYILKDYPLGYEIIEGVYVIYPSAISEMPEESRMTEAKPSKEKVLSGRKAREEFNKAVEIRKKEAIDRMADIRKAQKIFKDQHSTYAGSFDKLIHFIKNDSINIIRAIGVIPVTLIDSVGDIKKARELAFKRGLIQGNSYKVAVIDSVFGKRRNMVDSIRFVPFSRGSDFTMQTSELKSSAGQILSVIEVSVPFEILFEGLDPGLSRRYINDWKKLNKFPGLKFGSLEGPSLKGNWE